jgi:hypothetical protein
MIGQPIVQFGSQSNWSQVYSESREVEYLAPGKFVPLPRFELGTLFDSRYLAISAYSSKAKPTWRYAGYVAQVCRLGSGGTASPLPAVDTLVEKVYLGRARLLTYPGFTSNYALVFVPPYWLEDLTLRVYEYSGAVSDSITDRLIGLERSINALALSSTQQQPPPNFGPGLV